MPKFESVPSIIKEFRDNGTVLVINVSPDALGHVIGELENFVRMKALGEVSRSESILWIKDCDHRIATMRKLFGETICDIWKTGEYEAFLAQVIAHAAPDVTADAGFSSFKVVPPEDSDVSPSWIPGANVYRDFTGTWLRTGHDEWYRRRSLTPSLFPFMDVECSDAIEEFINAKGGKVAALQIKTNVASGSGALTNSADYEPALALLRDEGFTLVFAGREAMPEAWKKYGVVDYASSKIATFENDFRLFKRADFGLIGASGLSQFLEIFDKPYAYVNTSLTLYPPFSRKAVYTPAIFESLGRLLSFKEQQELLVRNIPLNIIHGRPEHITASVREALDRTKQSDRTPTPLQARYKAIGPQGSSCAYAQSVVCNAFLEEWEHLLPA